MLQLDIPGLAACEILHLVSDYSGTVAFGGALRPGVKARLVQLAGIVQVHILTADTFGTARRELAGLPVTLHLIAGERHEEQKRAYALQLGPQRVVALGNGNNDQLLLKAVREAGGLAIAVDNGEGCAIPTLLAADLVVHGAENALDLLLDTDRCKATLRL